MFNLTNFFFFNIHLELVQQMAEFVVEHLHDSVDYTENLAVVPKYTFAFDYVDKKYYDDDRCLDNLENCNMDVSFQQLLDEIVVELIQPFDYLFQVVLIVVDLFFLRKQKQLLIQSKNHFN